MARNEWKTGWGVRRRGFTLIELLVVVAIIALLISILLPSLNNARKSAKAVKCGANQNHVGKAVHAYLGENNGTFPASYFYNYAYKRYSLTNQPSSGADYGYTHWSYFLYNTGEADDASFQCPEFNNGGCPRTNPGPKGENWEPGQYDDNGSVAANMPSVEDSQATRMAYTGNAAVMPRNKFTRELSLGPRVNRFVRDADINTQRPVILAAEFTNNWKAIAVDASSGFKSKSHRSINPFFHVGSGSSEYDPPENTPGFVYGDPTSATYGLRPLSELEEGENLIDNRSFPETNAVGRHHPGGDRLGGTANFLYVDGSTQRKTILQTLDGREWGDKYYSLSGRNEVNMQYRAGQGE
ncbi:MAG: prepilin-type N-terminal cleavage/methylation domain-containing protein [Phycisphaerales bacterium]|nr:prepilin-type N-terminal cleavage/methylation domain-containing protein [Phycisphaerales bacterium]